MDYVCCNAAAWCCSTSKLSICSTICRARVYYRVNYNCHRGGSPSLSPLSRLKPEEESGMSVKHVIDCQLTLRWPSSKTFLFSLFFHRFCPFLTFGNWVARGHDRIQTRPHCSRKCATATFRPSLWFTMVKIKSNLSRYRYRYIDIDISSSYRYMLLTNSGFDVSTVKSRSILFHYCQVCFRGRQLYAMKCRLKARLSRCSSTMSSLIVLSLS